MYKLSFIAYCGMPSLPSTYEDRATARQAVAASLCRTRSSGRKVTTIDSGETWEVLEPEDARMVPDWAGTLHLSHHTYECRECGCEQETREAASSCCRDDAER